MSENTNPSNGRKISFKIIIYFFITLLILGIIVGNAYYKNMTKGISSVESGEDISLEIKKGSSTKQIAKIMYDEFLRRGFHMVDGKMEWGREAKTGEIVLIDDLSPDTFRVCEGYALDEAGNCTSSGQCIMTDYRQTSRFVKCANCLDFVEAKEDFKRFIEAKNILSADPTGLKKLAEAFKLEI